MDRQMLMQGAEAKVYLAKWLGKDVIIKERFVKEYRHPDLDTQIAKDRMKAEARALNRCRAVGIHTPAIYQVDLNRREIVMEYIHNSVTLRNYIQGKTMEGINSPSEDHEIKKIMGRVGEILAKLHSNNIIHGDLTTSNMLLVSPYIDSPIIMIDFGLSYLEEKAEDKAVDLYVLERAILSTHPNTDHLMRHLLLCYENAGGNAASCVLKKLDDVRQRGRKKLCFG